LIKQRILDEAFDDVPAIMYEAPLKENFTELDFTKSKQGLAEQYEEKYKETILNLGTSETDQQKLEIQK
jgi:U3 small nucleolar ribonucleoprotein component